MIEDYAAILALLPVRPPMVLVDRVVSLVPGFSIVVEKAVTGAEPCFAGMAEDLPAQRYAFPRSLVLESFGQAAALLWLGSRPGPGGRGLPMVGRVRHCLFQNSTFPGDVIRHSVRIDTVSGSNAFLSGASTVGDRTILSVGSLVAVERELSAVLADR